MKAIILGSSRGVRFVDPNRSYPSSLHELGGGGRVLDWILQAFHAEKVERSRILFVGGYHLEKVMKTYPDLKYYFQDDWEKGGAAAALRLVIDEIQGPCFVCDTNVVFRHEALASLRAARVDVAAGSLDGRDGRKADGALTGLACFSSKGAESLRKFLHEPPPGAPDLRALLKGLLPAGARSAVVDLTPHCAELHEKQSLARFVFGSKAQTLERLRPLVKHSRVLKQFRFFTREWQADRGRIVAGIQDLFGGAPVVVRSSAAVEDSWTASCAGQFVSVLEVDSGSVEALEKAVGTVIEGYEGAGLENDGREHEVFVQPHLREVSISGVALTRDLESDAPYHVVTVDRTSGQTDTVTGGSALPVETFVLYRNSQSRPPSPFLSVLLPALKELEELIGCDRLDVEFALDREGHLFVFQVRPLVNRNATDELADPDYEDELKEIRRFVAERLKPQPFLKGATTLLGNMPDWNPAEMIGAAPRPLALSLYEKLITDFAWAEARRRMGYRDLTSEPLLVALGGIPYIDLRVSFNSFLPASLDEDASERIVNACLDHLKAHPELHDKIEFEVAVTCLDFDFERQTARLREAGLPPADAGRLRSGLLQLTDAILAGRTAPIAEQEALLHSLQTRREQILKGIGDFRTLPRAIALLARDCVGYGSIPFSILARYAFIAMNFMRSLRARGVLAPDEFQAVLAEIPTVATEVSAALERLAASGMDRGEFISKYGHLRPGTYDILSPNYAQRIGMFLESGNRPSPPRTPARKPPDPSVAMEILRGKEDAVNRLLKENAFQCDANRVFDFIVRAIPAREWGKFELSKSVNEIVERTADYCSNYGLSRAEASCLSIERILRLETDSPSCALNSVLKRVCGHEAKRHILTRTIRLPHLIRTESDVDGFALLQWRPNFITDRRVAAEIMDLELEGDPNLLRGRIALIASADPGYDWIFGYSPAGLITQFGGAASHMAIRAAEFALPSAIGCGDLVYEHVRRARRVEIDCANRQLRILP